MGQTAKHTERESKHLKCWNCYRLHQCDCYQLLLKKRNIPGKLNKWANFWPVKQQFKDDISGIKMLLKYTILDYCSVQIWVNYWGLYRLRCTTCVVCRAHSFLVANWRPLYHGNPLSLEIKQMLNIYILSETDFKHIEEWSVGAQLTATKKKEAFLLSMPWLHKTPQKLAFASRGKVSRLVKTRLVCCYIALWSWGFADTN